MRSNSESIARARWKGTLFGWLIMAIAAACIGLVRYRLADAFHNVRAKNDVYTLPSPEQTVVMSLGYRSALADYIFSHLRVSYGLHFEEKRRFDFVGNYLDAISALEPKFRPAYRYADTFLTLQPVAPRLEDYVKAREIMERGLRELPDDTELWATAGQFLAYLAPGQFKDPAMQREWRMAGARMLAHACELVGKNENIPYHCITAASLFSKNGQRAAVIQFLERVLSVTDDEEIRRLALHYLETAVGEQQRVELEARHERFRRVWNDDLPFVSRDLLLVVGPKFDPAACAGREASQDPRCTTTWADWAKVAGTSGEH